MSIPPFPFWMELQPDGFLTNNSVAALKWKIYSPFLKLVSLVLFFSFPFPFFFFGSWCFMLRYAIRCLETTNVLLFLGLASLELTATLKFREKGGSFFYFFSLCLFDWNRCVRVRFDTLRDKGVIRGQNEWNLRGVGGFFFSRKGGEFITINQTSRQLCLVQ